MITKMEVQSLATAAAAFVGVAENAADSPLAFEFAQTVKNVAEYALKPAKRRKIFLVTVVTSDEDGSRQRVTYGAAAKNERRAIEMVEQALDDTEYEVKDVSERENPWVVSTGAEG